VHTLVHSTARRLPLEWRMNYLAHAYLARHTDAAMVGAMLGDFVKANDVHGYPVEIAREIMLHRHIDSYTDSHPEVRAARELFGEGRRRYAGIVLDVFYDHELSRHWAQWCDEPRAALIARFYGALEEREAMLPARLQEMLPYLVRQDWLGGYATFSGVEETVRRVSRRLSRNGELLRDGIGDLVRHREAIAQGFGRFFPDLVQFAAARRAELLAADATAAGTGPLTS
jgi:acyl carrier protein phosphodiesterase